MFVRFCHMIRLLIHFVFELLPCMPLLAQKMIVLFSAGSLSAFIPFGFSGCHCMMLFLFPVFHFLSVSEKTNSGFSPNDFAAFLGLPFVSSHVIFLVSSFGCR